MLQYVSALAAPLAAIIVAIIEWRAALDRKHAKDVQEKADKRQQIRDDEMALLLDIMLANMQLSQVTARALSGGTNNGNVEEAETSARNAVEKFNKFSRDNLTKLTSV